MTKYTVTTDAVIATVEARSRDDAARKFAAGEPVYAAAVRTAGDLSAAAEAMGGWASVAPE